MVGAGGRAKRVEDGSVGRPRFVMHNLWGCFTQCFKDFVRYLSDLASSKLDHPKIFIIMSTSFACFNLAAFNSTIRGFVSLCISV